MEERQLLALLLVVTVSATLSQETVQLATTRGESGVKCGRAGRQCVSRMRCVNKQCACPERESGNAEFECVQSAERVCFLTSDSRVYLEGFGKGGAPLNIPCSYRASRFVARKKGAHSYCGIEVHVTNERWRDSYRTRAVHVSVGVTEPFLQIQSNMETLVSGAAGLNRSRSYQYEVRSGPLNIVTWGSAHHLVKARRQVQLIRHSFDDVNNFVILDVPDCDTRIKFRAADSASNKQKLLPGVSITVADTAEFIPEMGDYPFSLCGRPQDPQSLYRDYARKEGLGDPAASVLAAVLGQQSPQFDNPAAAQCQEAMNLYATSRDQKADLEACEFLLTRKATRRCLVNRRLEPIDVFNACLKLRQTPNDVRACSAIRTAVSRCSSKWFGTKKFCQ